MPPKQLRTAAAPRQTHPAAQRTLQSQTSGIFKLPVEVLFEIFSYFDDHRRFIRRTRTCQPVVAFMGKENVGRSTVIRRLTATCWTMRDALLPVLWKDVEGCVVSNPRHGHTYGLYDQCMYLLSNPTIATYVQVLSVDLRFKDAPKDLMNRFVETLARLPNLRALELLSVTRRGPVTAGLKRKCANFPSIREMAVDAVYPDFIRSCPNLEDLTFRSILSDNGYNALKSYGAGLKRITGVNLHSPFSAQYVVESCPKLQEIGFFGCPSFCPFRNEQVFEHLRQAQHLSVVEFDYIEDRMGQLAHPPYVLEEKMNAWKRGFTGVLRDSPSKDRKFFRWRIVYRRIFVVPQSFDIAENGELEVFPRTTL